MRLNQVTASATDLEASIAFYQLLGLKLIVKSAHYARFELPRGEATFSLHISDGPIPREHAPQLYFECEDVDFEVRRLKHAGVAIEREPVEQSWRWYEAWLRDPAGNSICLYHAGENRRYPPWRIDLPPNGKTLYLIIREGEEWSLIKAIDDEALAFAQLQFGDFNTSLGPYDLFDLLALLETEWTDLFLKREEAIRAFAIGDDREMAL